MVLLIGLKHPIHGFVKNTSTCHVLATNSRQLHELHEKYFTAEQYIPPDLVSNYFHYSNFDIALKGRS